MVRGSKVWGAALAWLLLSQSGCIVSVLARELLEDDEAADTDAACESGQWSHGESSAFVSKAACEADPSRTQPCTCRPSAPGQPAAEP